MLVFCVKLSSTYKHSLEWFWAIWAGTEQIRIKWTFMLIKINLSAQILIFLDFDRLKLTDKARIVIYVKFPITLMHFLSQFVKFTADGRVLQPGKIIKWPFRVIGLLYFHSGNFFCLFSTFAIAHFEVRRITFKNQFLSSLEQLPKPKVFF